MKERRRKPVKRKWSYPAKTFLFLLLLTQALPAELNRAPGKILPGIPDESLVHVHTSAQSGEVWS